MKKQRLRVAMAAIAVPLAVLATWQGINGNGVDEAEKNQLVKNAEYMLAKHWERTPPQCSSVEDVALQNITFGTVSRTSLVSELMRDLPALIIGFDYSCVQGSTAGGDAMPGEHWTILAIDKKSKFITVHI